MCTFMQVLARFYYMRPDVYDTPSRGVYFCSITCKNIIYGAYWMCIYAGVDLSCRRSCAFFAPSFRLTCMLSNMFERRFQRISETLSTVSWSDLSLVLCGCPFGGLGLFYLSRRWLIMILAAMVCSFVDGSYVCVSIVRRFVCLVSFL